MSGLIATEAHKRVIRVWRVYDWHGREAEQTCPEENGLREPQ